MKRILTMAVVALMAMSAQAQNWKVDGAHSKVKFNVKYMAISETEGEFKKFDGTATSAKADWSDLNVSFNVDVNSISTDNEMRDGHLKGDDFFNAEKFPKMSFKSKTVKALGNNKFVMTGDMTIRDVTKSIEIPFSYGGTVKDPWGNTKAGFKATSTINRKDFGLKYKDAAATGEAIVGDDVTFTIDLVLIKG